MDRTELNKNQTNLKTELLAFNDIDLIREKFLKHHTHLHSSKISNNSDWSYEDEILNGLSEEKIRFIPQKSNHSIAWCIWHIARIEDITMSILVNNDKQVFNKNNFFEKLNTRFKSTGNGMLNEEVAEFSETVNIDELINYRITVGTQTQKTVKKLSIEKLKEKVKKDRIERLFREEALADNAKNIGDYWSKKDIAGLLLMPATRHNIMHLNEANKLSKKKK